MLRRKTYVALLCVLPLTAQAQVPLPSAAPLPAPMQPSAPPPPAQALKASPQAFLEEIYQPYLQKGFKGQPYWEATRFFEPELARAMDQNRQDARQRGKPPVLNGDPFVNAQDWQISGLVVAALPAGTGATGNVIFSNQGEPQHLTIDLVQTPDGWRIAEIRGLGLRALYKLR
ncbi:MAG: hypothetical protein ACHQK9_01805 [Reyranellales bacterium]